MRFSGRFFIVLGGIFLATSLVAPLVKLAIDGLLAVRPALAEVLHLDLADGQYDYGRVHRRVFMLVALVLILLNRRWLGAVRFHGMRPGDRRLRMLGAGLAVGLVSWAALLLALVVVGERTFAPSLSPGWPVRLAGALAAALLIAAIEESALRGWLLGGLLQDMPRLAAVLVSGALYSVLHFMRARVPVRQGGFDADVGLEALVAHLRPLGDPAVLLPFVGLLLVGVVLGYAYLWSRSLPLVIGLHAGWVFLIQSDGFLFAERLGRGGVYGERGVLAGALGWGFLLALLALLRPALRRLSPAAPRG